MLALACCSLADARTNQTRIPNLAPQAPWIQNLHELSAIRQRLKTGQKISARDQAFVLRMLDTSVLEQSASALLTLNFEVLDGVCTRRDSIRMLEPRLRTAKGFLAGHEFESIVAYLGLTGRQQSTQEHFWSVEDHGKSEHDLTAQQRTFLLNALSSSGAASRLLAGQLLVEKSQLSPEARDWALQLVTRQVNRSKGDEKRAWQIVKRTVVARSPGREGTR